VLFKDFVSKTETLANQHLTTTPPPPTKKNPPCVQLETFLHKDLLLNQESRIGHMVDKVT
jgi:hypothetical protein